MVFTSIFGVFMFSKRKYLSWQRQKWYICIFLITQDLDAQYKKTNKNPWELKYFKTAFFKIDIKKTTVQSGALQSKEDLFSPAWLRSATFQLNPFHKFSANKLCIDSFRGFLETWKANPVHTKHEKLQNEILLNDFVTVSFCLLHFALFPHILCIPGANNEPTVRNNFVQEKCFLLTWGLALTLKTRLLLIRAGAELLRLTWTVSV